MIAAVTIRYILVMLGIAGVLIAGFVICFFMIIEGKNVRQQKFEDYYNQNK